jgi:nucleoside-diphosphate-sugar epimerase
LKRVLVTGGAGFIGRRLLPMLARAGYEVHAVSSRAKPGGEGGITWHVSDLLDQSAPAELIEATRPSHLVHLAWYTEHGAFWASAENHRWVEASNRLWREFIGAEGERAVFAGTCAEYEWGEPILSESSRLRPATLYGASKDSLRRHLEATAADGPSFGWGRIFFPYGPGGQRKGLISSVATALLRGLPAPTTSGAQVRDFVYVDDVAAAFAALLQRDMRDPVNIGSGVGSKVRDVVDLLGRLTGRPELIEYGAMAEREDEPPSIVADVTRMEELGWRPQVDLEDGLARTVAALRNAYEDAGES